MVVVVVGAVVGSVLPEDSAAGSLLEVSFEDGSLEVRFPVAGSVSPTAP